MRIEKIKAKNYRQFKDIEIQFNKNPDNDLHIAIGRNGTGKTNILNVINWCLYGDEPHLSRDSQQLPFLNLKSIEEADNGEELESMVDVYVKTEDSRDIIFTRKANYIVHKGEKQQPIRTGSEFEVKVTDEKGNTKIHKDEDAYSYVERFVPKGIREFFFFDGERLDKYFKEATAQNIRHAVFEISQIDLLDNRMEERLKNILTELQKEAGKANPKIENAREILDHTLAVRDKGEEQIVECNKQIAIAKEKINEYDKELIGLPDTEALEKDRQNLKEKKKEKKKLRDEKVREKQDFLFEYAKIIRFYSAINKSIQIIQEKRRNKEIPPNIDKDLVEEILKNKFCTICGRDLDVESEKQVSNLVKNIKLSSEIAHQLQNMENPLRQFKDQIKNFKKKIVKITQEIDIYERDLAEIEAKIEDIDKRIGGFNTEKIKEWHNERKKYEKIHDDNQKRLGVLEGERKRLLNDIENYTNQLNEELKKEVKVKKLKKQIDFSAKALEVVRKTKENIMNETRNQIEAEAKKLFFGLIYKKETFKDIKIGHSLIIQL